MKTLDLIKKQIKSNKIILYMKGTPKNPSCCFSAKVSEILIKLNVKFGYVNVLVHKDIRNELPKYSKFYTYPQLWIKGSLIGGSDKVEYMYINGVLEVLINKLY
ncbi:MAG: glutaredoxin family protein [Enterobacteriaceae bacterium]